MTQWASAVIRGTPVSWVPGRQGALVAGRAGRMGPLVASGPSGDLGPFESTWPSPGQNPGYVPDATQGPQEISQLTA